MKKQLLLLFALLAAQCTARADLLYAEPFDYADGALTTVSGGVWTNHSGSGSVAVLSQKAVLSQAKGEDVSRGFSTGPLSSGFVYAAFTVNFSTLPAGTGGYFAHFRDNSTFNFYARLFATTVNAGSGNFRLGIASFNNTYVPVPTDLALNTDYKIVIRCNCANAQSTIWINPTSEESIINTATDAATTTAVPIYNFALRQAGSSPGMGVLTLDDLKVGTTFADVSAIGDPTKNPPLVSAIGTQSIPANSSTPAIPFTVNDGETAPASLVVTASSDNQTLVPDANIVLGGSGSARTITVTPAAGQQGTAVITVTVTDGDNNTATTSFSVIVGAPTISSIPNQITPANTPTQPIPFTIGDAETAPASLILSWWSSNPTLLPDGSVAFGGADANRTAVITPAAGQSGVAAVSFIVSDGANTATNRFVLTVTKSVGIDLDEPFTYNNGPIVDSSFGLWARYSGGTNEALIADNKLLISQTNSEDIFHYIGWSTSTSKYTTNEGFVLYYSFVLSALQLPAGPNGDYFTFLKDDGTSNFRGRIFVTTNGAAPGSYRVGLANGFATPSVVIANDLSLGNAYTLMLRYNVATAESALWLNPASEASASVSATDSTSPVNITTLAFRENRATNSSGGISQGMGTLLIDNAKQATAWADAYQAPNWPPTLSAIADQVTAYNTPTPALPLTVNDVESGAAGVILNVASTNTDLVPVANVVLGGSGTSRTVTVTPASGQSGITLITITAQDPAGQTASTSFLVTVLALNHPPTISSIPSQNTTPGRPIPTLNFTVSDTETTAGSLVVTASSSNPALVPDANIALGGEAANRTVTVTPVAGQLGTATITLRVSDGVNSTPTTFDVTVSLELLLREPFDYPDGPVTTNSGFVWKTHSGVAGETMVSSGRLLLSSALTEDINVTPTNAPFAPAGNAVLYAGFSVNFTEAPISNYFAHFKDVSTGFKGKVMATLSNAAPGTFRIGIANGANLLGATNPPYPLDLTTGVTYRIVMRYQVGRAISTLWINPTNETDTAVTATDNTSTITVTNFAFRQALGIGKMSVDDLTVGTTFDIVKNGTPPPPTLAIVMSNGNVIVSWPAAQGFELQSCPDIGQHEWQPAGLTVETVDGRSVVTVPISAGTHFYRLVK